MKRACTSLALLIACLQPLCASADPRDITLLFVGDVMLADGPGKLIRAGHDPFTRFASSFRQADLSIGNLECVISAKGKAESKPYTFRAPGRALPLLKKYFSAVSLANNHSGDFGKAAFADMLGSLEKQQISYFGGGRNLRDAHRPFVREIKGKRIGLLSYNGFFPRSFEALPDSPGHAWLDEDYVIDGIRKAKQDYGVDFLVVYPHWGWEYQKTASERQVRMAHLMIDAGADAVVGGHPHVTQNIEIYQGKPIFYSLGNFVFDGFKDEDSNTGWVLTMVLAANGSVDWTITEARIDPHGVPSPGRKYDSSQR
jgi:poly-gamma-glutamate synthesis protein (capsule biosynthesis protein)